MDLSKNTYPGIIIVKYFTKASFSNLETEREQHHRKLAYEAACEGIVLLENDGVLPLKPGNIALYGAGGLYTIKGGTGSGAAMTSYNKVNDVYAPESYDICTKVLRNEWGFDGVVMTDWMSTGRTKASAAKALAAGNDLIMAGLPWDKRNILKAYLSGRLPKDNIRRCCANVVCSIVHSKINQEIKAGYKKS